MDVIDLDADPLRQVSTWLDAARAARQPMPEAMTIATATSDAIPSARLVVLRGLQRGLVFFTDGLIDEGRSDAGRKADVMRSLVDDAIDTESLADSIVRVLGPSSRRGDDLALMVVRWSDVG